MANLPTRNSSEEDITTSGNTTPNKFDANPET